MKHFYRMMFVICSLFFCYQHAYSAIPNNDNPVTTLGPTLRGSLTGLLTDTSAYSFAGEVAINNLRISGSAGWNICDVHHLKLTAEYMGQRITYPFFNGNHDIVVNQGAIGAGYEFDISPYARWEPQFALNAYYANAPSSPLSNRTGTFINSAGVLQTYSDTQRLSGSNATGISPDFSIQPWHGGKIGLALNYDNVRYNMKYQTPVNATGMGGTAHFDQQLNYNIMMGASAAVRQPFNNYQADIGWYYPLCDAASIFKLFGAYTVGKKSLPDSYNFGLSVDYYLDKKAGTTLPEQAKQEFLTWMSTPAVYIPEVLSLTDEDLTVT